MFHLIPMSNLDSVEQSTWALMEACSEAIVKLLMELPKEEQENPENLLRNMALAILTQLAIRKEREGHHPRRWLPEMN